jgi:DNA polymerase
MRRSLIELYQEYQEDRRFAHLSKVTRFVSGEGCDYFPLVVFIGEAPGAAEEESGRPFVGASGRLLRRCALASGGFTEQNSFITNVVKYRPPRNRPPTPSETATGRYYLRRELAILTPEVVVPLGRHALQACLPEQADSITALHGVLIQSGGRSYFPLLHPSAILRTGGPTVAYAHKFRELRKLLG